MSLKLGKMVFGVNIPKTRQLKARIHFYVKAGAKRVAMVTEITRADDITEKVKGLQVMIESF